MAEIHNLSAYRIKRTLFDVPVNFTDYKADYYHLRSTIKDMRDLQKKGSPLAKMMEQIVDQLLEDRP